MKTPETIKKGKDNGEGMVVHYRTTRGTGIFGLGVPNAHINSDWDLGPTWCYLILGQKTTLIDTGRFGNFYVLESLLKEIGKNVSDIDRVIITHSHDDHDGNLARLLSKTQAELWAHSIYPQMILYHPDIGDGAAHPELPGSCRWCIVPEYQYRYCLEYHEERSLLNVNFVFDEAVKLTNDISLVFTPGHSPDSICIILEGECIFTGDTLLPDITPHPSLAKEFGFDRRILPERYQEENTVYGLMNYIKSLNKIIHLESQPLQATFPAHRLFHRGQFDIIASSAQRARDIIQFHIDRCLDILRIAGNGRPVDIDAIAVQHFPASLLKGTGETMAHREIEAHLEVMEESGDIRWDHDSKDAVQSAGPQGFISLFKRYL